MTASSLAFLAGRDGLPKTDWHEWFNDFDFYLATDWVITETGSGTRAISQAKGGILLITNAAADDDANFLQKRDVASGQVAEHFKWVSGKRMYFGARFKVSDATQSDFVMGLQITDTTPLAVSDGIYFRKDDGDNDLDCIVIKDSTSTGSLAPSSKINLADDTYYVMEWYYDGKTAANGGMIQFFVDGVNVGNVDLDNVNDDEEMCVSFGIQNGEAVAKSMSLDWIRVLQER